MELITNHIDDTVCPIARTAEIISGKWTLLIIRDLASGVKRFNQLERSLHGISPKTLSERLRSLEEEGIVYRQTFAEVPHAWNTPSLKKAMTSLKSLSVCAATANSGCVMPTTRRGSLYHALDVLRPY